MLKLSLLHVLVRDLQVDILLLNGSLLLLDRSLWYQRQNALIHK